MKDKKGFSIIEVLVVIVIIATLVALAIPALNAMQKSFDSTGAEGMVSAALATARTIAMTKQRYAGIRFQGIGEPNSVLKANQYMIFIVYEETGKIVIVDGFRAIEGHKPIKLPASMGIIDLTDIKSDTDIDTNNKLWNATKFSVVFSPAGKLTVHNVQTRNKDGKPDTDNSSKDDVFNTATNIRNGIGMFIQDNQHEQSRTKFIIYNRDMLNKLSPADRYSKYLIDLKPVLINVYTGEIIK